MWRLHGLSIRQSDGQSVNVSADRRCVRPIVSRAGSWTHQRRTVLRMLMLRGVFTRSRDVDVN
jgi:hypothetical protein